MSSTFDLPIYFVAILLPLNDGFWFTLYMRRVWRMVHEQKCRRSKKNIERRFRLSVVISYHYSLTMLALVSFILDCVICIIFMDSYCKLIAITLDTCIVMVCTTLMMNPNLEKTAIQYIMGRLKRRRKLQIKPIIELVPVAVIRNVLKTKTEYKEYAWLRRTLKIASPNSHLSILATFYKHEVTDDRLADLDKEDWEKMIPQIGIRVAVQKQFQAQPPSPSEPSWIEQSFNASLSIGMSDRITPAQSVLYCISESTESKAKSHPSHSDVLSLMHSL
eukprot:132712_1